MANINISDLTPTGSHFFLNSENYLNELSDSELNSIYGGRFPFTTWSIPRSPLPIPPIWIGSWV